MGWIGWLVAYVRNIGGWTQLYVDYDVAVIMMFQCFVVPVLPSISPLYLPAISMFISPLYLPVYLPSIIPLCLPYLYLSMLWEGRRGWVGCLEAIE